MTSTKLAKVVAHFAGSVATRATYELDGVVQQAEVSVYTFGATVRVMVDVGISVKGKIGNVRLYDADGDLVDSDNFSFVKTLGKRFYFAFVYTFEERVV